MLRTLVDVGGAWEWTAYTGLLYASSHYISPNGPPNKNLPISELLELLAYSYSILLYAYCLYYKPRFQDLARVGIS